MNRTVALKNASGLSYDDLALFLNSLGIEVSRSALAGRARSKKDNFLDAEQSKLLDAALIAPQDQAVAEVSEQIIGSYKALKSIMRAWEINEGLAPEMDDLLDDGFDEVDSDLELDDDELDDITDHDDELPDDLDGLADDLDLGDDLDDDDILDQLDQLDNDNANEKESEENADEENADEEEGNAKSKKKDKKVKKSKSKKDKKSKSKKGKKSKSKKGKKSKSEADDEAWGGLGKLSKVNKANPPASSIDEFESGATHEDEFDSEIGGDIGGTSSEDIDLDDLEL